MHLFLFPGDGTHRAGPGAQRTAGAFFFIDAVGDQGLTDLGRAPFFKDVGLIFVPEIAQGG
jgi:hypothetical protein